MESKFNVGERVRCTKGFASGYSAARVISGATYEVITAFNSVVYLKDCGDERYCWSAHRFERIDHPVSPTLTGGSSDYYKLPPGATDIMDLIEHKDMGFALGNIFKAVYRLGDKPGTTQKYDLEKIIYFAQRELDRLSP